MRCGVEKFNVEKIKPLFERHFKKGEQKDCWDWNGFSMSKGYGGYMFTDSRKRIMAHRLSFIIYKGDFERNLLVCHKCDNKKCVNPEHLFLGTAKDNTLDMMKKNRACWQKNPKKYWGIHERKICAGAK